MKEVKTVNILYLNFLVKQIIIYNQENAKNELNKVKHFQNKALVSII